MELNSLLILLEAAEYLERRDRAFLQRRKKMHGKNILPLMLTLSLEAEHGYASVLPFDSDYSRKKTKAGTMARKSQNNRSSHNELEKHSMPKVQLIFILHSSTNYLQEYHERWRMKTHLLQNCRPMPWVWICCADSLCGVPLPARTKAFPHSCKWWRVLIDSWGFSGEHV
ncbi:max dimerization protein 4 isoform 6-T6 [Morphnus guianensis]